MIDWNKVPVIPENPRAVEICRLRAINADLLAVARAYEAWEADLVLNADWSRSTPTMTQAQFDRMMEIQAMRNAAIAKAEEEA